jgi:hypothetical protein
MISLFVLSWLPYAIVSQLAINGLQHYVTPYTAEFPAVLAKASYVWNPIVYALCHPRYRNILVRCTSETESDSETSFSSRRHLRASMPGLTSGDHQVVRVIEVVQIHGSNPPGS